MSTTPEGSGICVMLMLSKRRVSFTEPKPNWVVAESKVKPVAEKLPVSEVKSLIVNAKSPVVPLVGVQVKLA